VEENKIHPTAIIGGQVELGVGNVIGPGAILMGNTRLGSYNWVGPGAVIGGFPDIFGTPNCDGSAWWDSQSQSSEFGVRVGSRNIFKEHVTVHAGSHRDTAIADDCYLMPRAHLGHDCWIGNTVMLSPSVQVAGHVAIGERAVIGMGALIHQFSAVGPVSMVGMGAVVRGLVEPCRTVVGEPHKVSGINKIGISRLLGPDVDLSSVLRALREDSVNDGNFPRLSLAIDLWRQQVVTR
jgi:UDP-N-acetylglucosamine acyltransferase